MEKIKLEDIQETSGIDFDKMYKDCLVDVNEELIPPPIAMGIGYHNYKGKQYLNTTFTYGEMSAIIAPQKTKKTFFKSALISSYIGGNANSYFPDIISNREKEMWVLDFDTEQGKYYTQRSLKRVSEMVGSNYVKYKGFGLKGYDEDEMLEFIDTEIKRLDSVGWVSIDGIADLCFDSNDINQSKKVIKKLLEWTSLGIHVNCVIHKTFDKDKGTGHLGSYVQKKSETTIFLESTEKDNINSPVKVWQKDSRGAPFEPFYFEIDNDTALPKQCEYNIF